MSRYICLLRSVNVAGVNLIKMTELKDLFHHLGFREVTTYIQSGNILFEAEESPAVAYIENAIRERFHTRQVAAILKTPEEINLIICQNPFAERPGFQPKNLYVHYLQERPREEHVQKITGISFENEDFVLVGTVIYVYYEIPSNRAKLSNAFFEKALQVRATARNWNTTQKLLEIAGSIL